MNDNVPQPEDLSTSKRPDDVHGHRWTVTGVHGRVTYRELAGSVQIVSGCGDRDHAGGRWPVRAAAAAETGDDEAVFAVLTEVYEANWGGAAPEPSNPDRRCRRCGATQGLKMLHRNPLTLAACEWECYDDCAGGAS